jgi:cell division protein FtsX
MEGILQGGVGAVAALVALGAAFLALRGRYLVPLAGVLNLSSVRFLSPELCLLVLVGGMLVGCVGGLIAASGRA